MAGDGRIQMRVGRLRIDQLRLGQLRLVSWTGGRWCSWRAQSSPSSPSAPWPRRSRSGTGCLQGRASPACGSAGSTAPRRSGCSGSGSPARRQPWQYGRAPVRRSSTAPGQGCRSIRIGPSTTSSARRSHRPQCGGGWRRPPGPGRRRGRTRRVSPPRSRAWRGGWTCRREGPRWLSIRAAPRRAGAAGSVVDVAAAVQAVSTTWLAATGSVALPVRTAEPPVTQAEAERAVV